EWGVDGILLGRRELSGSLVGWLGRSAAGQDRGRKARAGHRRRPAGSDRSHPIPVGSRRGLSPPTCGGYPLTHAGGFRLVQPRILIRGNPGSAETRETLSVTSHSLNRSRLG